MGVSRGGETPFGPRSEKFFWVSIMLVQVINLSRGAACHAAAPKLNKARGLFLDTTLYRNSYKIKYPNFGGFRGIIPLVGRGAKPHEDHFGILKFSSCLTTAFVEQEKSVRCGRVCYSPFWGRHLKKKKAPNGLFLTVWPCGLSRTLR